MVVAPREVVEELPEVAVPIVPEALPADPEAFWSAPPLPVALQEPGARSIGDDDVFEKLRDWPKLEYQFSQAPVGDVERSGRRRQEGTLLQEFASSLC